MVPVIVGPTAAGKSALAMRIASQRSVEIVSADSRQVYIGMDIGTAKPSLEERSAVRHHLIDIVNPDHVYSAGQFARAAREVINDIIARDRIPLVVGGSGFYIKALFEGLTAPEVDGEIIAQLEERAEREGYQSLVDELARVDPVAASAHSPNNRVKTLRALACFYQTGVPYSAHAGAAIEPFEQRPCYVGITTDRQVLYDAINARASRMIDDGMIEETERLLAARFAHDAPGLRTVGYKEAIAHITGEISREAMIASMQQSTRRYAKRQLTWFRGIEAVRWFDSRTFDLNEVLSTIDDHES